MKRLFSKKQIEEFASNVGGGTKLYLHDLLLTKLNGDDKVRISFTSSNEAPFTFNSLASFLQTTEGMNISAHGLYIVASNNELTIGYPNQVYKNSASIKASVIAVKLTFSTDGSDVSITKTNVASTILTYTTGTVTDTVTAL